MAYAAAECRLSIRCDAVDGFQPSGGVRPPAELEETRRVQHVDRVVGDELDQQTVSAIVGAISLCCQWM